MGRYGQVYELMIAHWLTSLFVSVVSLVMLRLISYRRNYSLIQYPLRCD